MGRAVILLFLFILTFALPTWVLAAEECVGGKNLPPSDATQGGFGFEVLSNSGTIEGVQCTLHKARNKPGGVKTPIDWVDTTTNTKLLFAKLPGCKTDREQCDCNEKPCTIEAQKPRHAALWDIRPDVTELKYGIHYEYNEAPDAIVARKKKEAALEKPPPFIFRLRGFAETSKENVVFIDIEVRSVFVPDEKSLRFDIINRGDTLVHLAPDPQKFEPVIAEKTIVAASWSPVTSEKFQKSYNLQGNLADLPAVIDIGGFLNGSLSIGKVTIDETAMLTVYVDGEPVAGASMGLYVPAQ